MSIVVILGDSGTWGAERTVMSDQESREHESVDSLDLASASRLVSALVSESPLSSGEESESTGGTPGHLGRDAPQIEGYTIEEELGEGASGRVYRARRTGSELAVAIKILHRRLDSRDDPGGQRAWRELDLLAQLRLPCLPRLIDFGVTRSRLYIATELVDGLNLVRHCEAHKLNRRQRVKLIAELADAVQALHEHGVIHRDIKPSNVLVNSHGQPVLIDLGVASLLARDALETLTAEGAPIGSPAFMSPEQARGEGKALSTRTDVYALASTALYTLTGCTLHDLTGATIHQAIRRVADEPPRDPRSIDPGLPKPLAAVLSKALSRRPADRYATAAEFAVDLRRWLRGEHVHATSPRLWTRLARWVERHPIATTTAACLAIVLLIATSSQIALWWANERPAKFVVTPDKGELRLLTASGRLVKSWPNDPRSQDATGQLVRCPLEMGGGRIALTLTDSGRAGDAQSRRLCAWSLDNFDEPLWTTPIGAPGIVTPDSKWKSDDDSYGVRRFLVRDVFPESPGVELIVQHTHQAYHPACLRVYDLTGDVLYECWHAGAIAALYWHESHRQLIFTGYYGWADLTRFGVEVTDSQTMWPLIVGAVEPVLGQRVGWAQPFADEPAAPPAWYKAILPFNHLSEIDEIGSFEVGPPEQPQLRSTCTQVMFSIGDGQGGVSWTLDRHGRIVGEPIVSDDLAIHHPDSPEKYLTLGDMPRPHEITPPH